MTDVKWLINHSMTRAEKQASIEGTKRLMPTMLLQGQAAFSLDPKSEGADALCVLSRVSGTLVLMTSNRGTSLRGLSIGIQHTEDEA